MKQKTIVLYAEGIGAFLIWLITLDLIADAIYATYRLGMTTSTGIGSLSLAFLPVATIVFLIFIASLVFIAGIKELRKIMTLKNKIISRRQCPMG